MKQGTQGKHKYNQQIVLILHLKKEASIRKWLTPAGKETENILWQIRDWKFYFNKSYKHFIQNTTYSVISTSHAKSAIEPDAESVITYRTIDRSQPVVVSNSRWSLRACGAPAPISLFGLLLFGLTYVILFSHLASPQIGYQIPR